MLKLVQARNFGETYDRPLLLLDDYFDVPDASRGRSRLPEAQAGDNWNDIITDTNREHLIAF